MKLIDNILDNYFSKKVCNLAEDHLARCGRKSEVFYNDVNEGWEIGATIDTEKVVGLLPYMEFRKAKAPITLIALLRDGWGELDTKLAEREKKFLSEDFSKE